MYLSFDAKKSCSQTINYKECAYKERSEKTLRTGGYFSLLLTNRKLLKISDKNRPRNT